MSPERCKHCARKIRLVMVNVDGYRDWRHGVFGLGGALCRNALPTTVAEPA